MKALTIINANILQNSRMRYQLFIKGNIIKFETFGLIILKQKDGSLTKQILLYFHEKKYYVNIRIDLDPVSTEKGGKSVLFSSSK